mmetsp:Transcript_36982/g.82211  ORF Transcript_36982/g.82211 Transcript_36982/m.82211 type:complete len:1366 (+) Transcript_36982:300-4397(+)|eukprot:CAMPEP_0202894752 /NCGR_PEP_ID=MMETSP1392-20130828/4080_1 /ASSEMBLY_ACC=CAM_ASM_000868 /TAXON_ID=225041 /ORGANISM="Chlamydomonas chlamydogama, Strain SAG 11-48b" /LENGTH=1365 /DNA_ID=CAMNT_0049579533 /DNA_START=245 /DNA_END=4342 /DNA_ORIENTATION=+
MKHLFALGVDLFGDGRVIFEWSPKGNFLAAAGAKRKVNVFDRNGRLYDEIALPQPEMPTGDVRASSVVQLQWDPSGELLAILPNGNSIIYMWSSISREIQKIDTEFKTQEFSAMSWSKNGMYLAVGTGKGNLLLYNSRERKRTPYVGKHTKKITCIAWNKDNLLATAGMDRVVSITDGTSGETTRTFQIKGDPHDLCVSDKKDDGYAKHEENTYSVNVARKTIYIMQCGSEGDKPLELAFLDQYGAIQKHLWFGDGYIFVAFRSGQVVVVSSHAREIAEEIHSGKYLDVLADVSYSPSLGRVALVGSSCVRVMNASGTDFSEIKADAIDLDANITLDRVGWTRDGQVLTISTTTGQVYSYLAALPVVFDYYQTKVIYLTSLLEMSVVDVTRRATTSRIDIESEPAFCGLGPGHAALGMNNQVWFYRLSGASSRPVNRRDYMGSVQSIKLNATHAAVLLEGRVLVHPIETEAGRSMDEFDMALPPPGSNQTITSIAVTSHFIITASRQGVLSYYLTQDCSPVNEYRHDDGAVLRIFPQPEGSRLIFDDEKGNINLFNPVNDQVLVVPNFNNRAENIMWDVSDPSLFVIADTSALYVYLHYPVSLTGAKVELIGKQPLPATHTPLMCTNGNVGCRLKNGSLDSVILDTHRALQINDALSRAAPQRRFQQCLKLCRIKAAWECAVQMRSQDAWRQLGLAALEVLDVDMAIACFRMVGDPSMVLSLETIRNYEDKNLLSGHIMVLLERDHAQAQELFLRSSNPKAALEMRKDLKHWSEALKLAEQLDPDSIPLICKEHAASLEMIGEYSLAKTHYQQAMDSLMGHSDKELELACRAGIARTTLQMGDIRQGRSMALQLNSQPLFKECAQILEGLQQLTEAGEMYERAGQYERAASIYIQTKNFAAATPLMAKVSSSKLQLQFAKAKEAEGRYAEAAAAYEAAGDMDSVVRLALEHLGAPQRAYAIVRKTQSVEAAGQLAKFCLQSQDFQGAVEFLLLAGQMDQAFDIAQKYNEMDTFARIVTASAKPVDYQRIAQYYESRGEYDKAGDMWSSSGQDAKAVQLYLKVGNNMALDKAIAVVEKTKNHNLGVLVLDYVNEEKDGSAKDEYRFKLNIAMGQYTDAAKDAMEMARFEQEEGNYRVAHDKLFATVKQLEGLHKAVPSELLRMLMLLHSYTLVKSLIAIEDHTTAARMLIRVARNISKFPKHVVPILTSTVIECHRAGLKKTAFEYASMLMRPEYRNQVAMKYKKKIELMVRKPDKDAEEAEEALLECPFCNMPGPETELQCISCQNIIPFDISTGKRMTLADWSECPTCKFPCSARQFIRILAAERRCCMCNEEINLDTVRKVGDPLGQLRKKAEEAAGLPAGAA